MRAFRYQHSDGWQSGPNRATSSVYGFSAYLTVAIDIPRAVRWHNDAVRIIDQTLLPVEFREIDLIEIDAIVEAIQSLRVRGAPAIGIAAALGLVASLKPHVPERESDFRVRLERRAAQLREARPTAVNLAWAVDRLLALANDAGDVPNAQLWEILREEALAILEEDREMCRR
ncbi:MAG TPA: hypothetical protein VLC48_02375, partial [Gemmatimonadota bacterium]|nr:hypothetical protein [Gemmatimonadota bacterium]